MVEGRGGPCMLVIGCLTSLLAGVKAVARAPQSFTDFL
jgi:hypothetical protein